MDEKKKEHSSRRIGTILFLLIWIATYIANWVLFVLILGSLSFYPYPGPAFQNFLTALALGGLLIILIAPMQRYLIRYNYQINLRGWVWRSVAASIIVLGVYQVLWEFSDPNVASRTLDGILLIAMTGVPGIVQWFVLRQHIRQAWLWVCGSIVTGLVVVGLFNTVGNNWDFIDYVLISGLQGVITGGVMVFLLAQNHAEKSKQNFLPESS